MLDMVSAVISSNYKNKKTNEWVSRSVSVIFLNDIAVEFSKLQEKDMVKVKGYFNGEYKKDLKRNEYSFFATSFEKLANKEYQEKPKNSIPAPASNFEITNEEIPF
jgi:hypothetical protein